MAKPDHDCGEACRALNEKQYRAHFEFLKQADGSGEQWLVDAYGAAGYSIKNRKAAYVSASQLLSSPKMEAALDHHAEVEAVRYTKTKARSIERLAALAEGASMGHFAKIEDGRIVIDDTTSKTPDELRAVGTLKDTQHGVEITVRDGVAAERALATLGGWNAPTKIDVSDADARWGELAQAASTGDDDWAVRCLAEAGEGAPAALAAWRRWQAGDPG